MGDSSCLCCCKGHMRVVSVGKSLKQTVHIRVRGKEYVDKIKWSCPATGNTFEQQQKSGDPNSKQNNFRQVIKFCTCLNSVG